MSARATASTEASRRSSSSRSRPTSGVSSRRSNATFADEPAESPGLDRLATSPSARSARPARPRPRRAPARGSTPPIRISPGRRGCSSLRGDVDRVAGGEACPGPTAPPRCSRRSGAQPDARRLDSRSSAVERRSSRRRAHRPQRVVLVHDRHAEDRHHRVADELLDRPAVAFDDRVRRRSSGPSRRERLGIEPLAEARRAGHVGEQDRDDLARLGVTASERGAAGRTKPRLLGVLLPAVRTADGQGTILGSTAGRSKGRRRRRDTDRSGRAHCARRRKLTSHESARSAGRWGGNVKKTEYLLRDDGAPSRRNRPRASQCPIHSMRDNAKHRSTRAR